MQRLEDIGFYTLSDARAQSSSATSRLMRCEILLGSQCNLACQYCRRVGGPIANTATVEQVLDYWISERLYAVRFSGGEPTLHLGLPAFVSRCKDGGIKRIAVSTNGTAPLKLYDSLISYGVNDFSVSLDACCAADGDRLAGNVRGAWDATVAMIQHVSKKVYTTVGIVASEDNQTTIADTIRFAISLGVSDVRVIPAAQWLPRLDLDIPTGKPILNYRATRARLGLPTRGIQITDTPHCWLALDDMCVIGSEHYPCIIYAREGGRPIGRIGNSTRADRATWVRTHNTHADPICRTNCLDVCVDYNNKKQEFI